MTDSCMSPKGDHSRKKTEEGVLHLPPKSDKRTLESPGHKTYISGRYDL